VRIYFATALVDMRNGVDGQWGARASRSPKTQHDDRPERVIAIAAVTSDGAA